MTYRLKFHAAASAQIPGLPADAYKALVDTLVQVIRDPWNNSAPDHTTEPEYRWAMFGEFGIVLLRVNDDRGMVHVYDVTWTG